MIRATRLLFVAAAFSIAFPASFAATPLEMTGGDSGFKQAVSCQMGEAMVGATVLLQNRDSIFAGIMPMCDAMQSGGALAGAPHAAMGSDETFFRGVGTLETKEEWEDRYAIRRKTRTAMCPAGARVSGYQAVAADDSVGIGFLRLDCSGSGATTVVTLATATVPTSPREGGHFRCAANEAATGVTGRSGAWLQAVGLMCGTPDAGQLAIQNENDKLFDKMEKTRLLHKNTNSIAGLYRGFFLFDGVMVYDHSNGRAAGFWRARYQSDWQTTAPVDPDEPSHRYIGGVDLHGLADADGKLIGKPNYLEPVIVHSPQIASVLTRKHAGILLSLETGQEKVPALAKYNLVVNKQAVGLFTEGLVTDPGGTTLHYMNADGSPGKTFEHIVGFQEHGLYTQLSQKATSDSTKTLWINLDQTLSGTTPGVKMLLTYRGTPQSGIELGSTPSGLGKVVYPSLYRVMSLAGLPHSQPEEVVGVAPFAQVEIGRYGWVFVSRKEGTRSFRVSSKSAFDEAVKEYDTLFPYLELAEVSTKEILTKSESSSVKGYQTTMVMGRVGADDWIPVVDNLTANITSKQDVIALLPVHHARTAQAAVDAQVYWQNEREIQFAANTVDDWLRTNNFNRPGHGEDLLQAALSAGGDYPARVAKSQWMVEINRIPGAIDRLCAHPSVKDCTDLRNKAFMQLAEEKRKECAWNARLCMNAGQLAKADAELEEIRRRGTPAQQWDRAIAAYQRDSATRISNMGNASMKTQDRNNTENCAAAAKGANRNCSIR